MATGGTGRVFIVSSEGRCNMRDVDRYCCGMKLGPLSWIVHIYFGSHNPVVCGRMGKDRQTLYGPQ